VSVRHLLTTEGASRAELEELLDLADEFADVLDRDIPKVPALRGLTVGTLFFEPSTRTRLSFERAAKALSADVMSFAPGSSSLSKGESLKDTVLTLQSMGCDLMVVRHTATGAPWRVAEWVDCPVVNGGDGAHQHPTQALLDSLTIRRRFGKLDDLRIAIVGDIRHSRVARSDLFAFSTLGARVTMVAPPTLLPLDIDTWPCDTSNDLDEVLGTADVVYLLRIQFERGGGTVFPSLPEYVSRFGMTAARFAALPPESVIMHPGPMNRGVEIAPDVADHPRSLVLDQVRLGVAVRMAVLFRLGQTVRRGTEVPG
jgi:aspartate carbamoyltransferase catalytic subunit